MSLFETVWISTLEVIIGAGMQVLLRPGVGMYRDHSGELSHKQADMRFFCLGMAFI